MPRKQDRRGSRDYFTKALTRKQAKRQVRTAARLAIRPERRQIKSERRAVRQEKEQIRDWFPQYQEQLAATGAQTQAAYQGAQQSVKEASQGTSAYAEQLRQRLASEAQADAARRGVAYDPSGSKTFAAADAAARNSADTLAGVLASQAASQQAYSGQLSSNAAREMVNQLGLAQKRKRSYSQDLRALAREEGMLRRDEFSRLRDSERDYLLGLAASRLDKRSLRSSNRQARASGREDAASDKRYLRSIREQGRQSRKTKERTAELFPQQGRDRGPGGDEVRTALGYIRQGAKPGWSRKRVIDYLVNRGVSAAAARRASRRAFRKSVRPDQNPNAAGPTRP